MNESTYGVSIQSMAVAVVVAVVVWTNQDHICAPIMFITGIPAACSLSTAHFGGTPTAEMNNVACKRTEHIESAWSFLSQNIRTCTLVLGPV